MRLTVGCAQIVCNTQVYVASAACVVLESWMHF